MGCNEQMGIRMTRLAAEYRRRRAYQAKIASEGGGMLTVDPSGRKELSYGAAPYGRHALSAWTSAKRHLNFLASRGID